MKRTIFRGFAVLLTATMLLSMASFAEINDFDSKNETTVIDIGIGESNDLIQSGNDAISEALADTAVEIDNMDLSTDLLLEDSRPEGGRRKEAYADVNGNGCAQQRAQDIEAGCQGDL